MSTVAITHRRLKVPYDKTQDMRFFGGNLLTSAYFTSVSCVLPAFEKGIIRTVRDFEPLVTHPKLKAELWLLIKQEGHHSYQHGLMNKRISDLGFDAANIENEMVDKFEAFIRDKTLIERLAVVVCFEHLSSVLSEVTLKHDQLIADCDEVVLNVFMWHCMEELEHKSVLFDIYMDSFGDRALLKRTMAKSTAFILSSVNTNISELIKRTGQRVTLAELAQHLRLYLGLNGIVWKAIKPYFAFYRQGFHPSLIDTQDLMDKWKRLYFKSEYQITADQ